MSQLRLDDLPGPWGVQPLEGDAIHGVRIGPRDLWIQRTQGEIRVVSAAAPPSGGVPASEPSVTEPASTEPSAHVAPLPPAGATWTRWALTDEDQVRGEALEVSVLPVFPSRTLIVEPEDAFTLRPRASARVFVRIPLSIQVAVGPEGASPLLEVPTLELSDTWWGGVMEGELCSWLGTRARRRVDATLLEPHLAICPLFLLNESEQDLRVERLAFRPEFLTLFAEAPGFWSDESRVRYQGDAEGSQIEVTGRAPAEAGDARAVRPPRTSPRGAGVRPLSRLIGLAGIGGAS
jgi:hypothetical protein